MGIGSLSKYRRAFMVGGFTIFAAGALLRWHHQRQLESLQSVSPNPGGPTMEITWKDDCVTYACRVIGARGPECRELCDRATDQGGPRTRAERIANACKQHCVAEEDSTATCRSECFVRESRAQAGRR